MSNLSFLLAKSYHTQENVLFEAQLKQTAISVPDREKLYAFIHTEKKEELIPEILDSIEEKEISPAEEKVTEKASNPIEESEEKISPTKNLEKIVSEKKETLESSENAQLEKLILSSAMSSVSLLDEYEIEGKDLDLEYRDDRRWEGVSGPEDIKKEREEKKHF